MISKHQLIELKCGRIGCDKTVMVDVDDPDPKWSKGWTLDDAQDGDLIEFVCPEHRPDGWGEEQCKLYGWHETELCRCKK